MSQANVELTRRAFQAFNDRDLDAVLAGLHDDDSAVWHVNQFRDDKVIRWRVYTSESEALEAAGLRE